MADLALFVDVTARQIVRGFNSSVPVSLPSLVQGDNVNLSLRFLSQTGNSTSPYVDADYTGRTIKVGVGNPTARPTAGTFTLSYGAQVVRSGSTTASSAVISSLSGTADIFVGMPVSGTGIPAGATVATIASSSSITISIAATATGTPSLTFDPPVTSSLGYGATLAQVATALNALSTITAVGGVSVSGTDSGGPYLVTFTSAGSRPLIGGSSADLFPLTNLTSSRFQTGSSTIQEIQRLRLYVLPAAFQSSFSNFPGPDGTITRLQAGAAGVNEAQRIALSNSPYAGTFSLSFGGKTTNPISFNATSTEVYDALVALSSIGSGNVSVTGNDGGPWTVTFIGTMSGTPEALISGDFSGLTVPIGKTGFLNLGTVGIDDIIGFSDSAPATLEIQVTDADGNISTPFRGTVTLLNDLIEDAATIPVPIDSYFTTVQALAAFVQNRFSITGLTGGGSTNLDGIATAGGAATAGWVVEIGNAQNKWLLVAGTHASNPSGGFVLPTDYNASTNALYWLEVG